MTHADKIECREIARQIVQEVLKEHITSCPHGRAMYGQKMLLLGLMVGSGMAGGSVGAMIVKMLMAGA